MFQYWKFLKKIIRLLKNPIDPCLPRIYYKFKIYDYVPTNVIKPVILMLWPRLTDVRFNSIRSTLRAVCNKSFYNVYEICTTDIQATSIVSTTTKLTVNDRSRLKCFIIFLVMFEQIFFVHKRHRGRPREKTTAFVQCVRQNVIAHLIMLLTWHERVHTGKNSYSCDVFRKNFVTPGRLKRHERVHAVCENRTRTITFARIDTRTNSRSSDSRLTITVIAFMWMVFSL